MALPSKRKMRSRPVGVAVALLVAIVGATVALLLSSTAGAAPGEPNLPAPTASPEKATAPMNINPAPGKEPVLDPGKITNEVGPPLPPDEAAAESRRWAAQDPKSRVACFRPDGLSAGAIMLDRVNPDEPLTQRERVAACRLMAPDAQP